MFIISLSKRQSKELEHITIQQLPTIQEGRIIICIYSKNPSRVAHSYLLLVLQIIKIPNSSSNNGCAYTKHMLQVRS